MKVIWEKRKVAKGELIELIKGFFKDRGYKIKILDDQDKAHVVAVPKTRGVNRGFVLAIECSSQGFAIEVRDIHHLNAIRMTGLALYMFGGNFLFRAAESSKDSIEKTIEELILFIEASLASI